MARYLTKSRFKLALECYAKLYYTGKKEYVDSKLTDPFLAALAEGGFQVGELAKLYVEGGHNIEELNHVIALERTSELLKQDEVVIYEAAFSVGDLFVRADIVRKSGKHLRLIEVKAKSFDPSSDTFLTQKGTVRAEWSPYLFDIAFQYHVVTKALPGYTVEPILMLADKRAQASVEGLNQLFFLDRSGTRAKAIVKDGIGKKQLGTPILKEVPVKEIVAQILGGIYEERSFSDFVEWLAQKYKEDDLILQPLGGRCGECEYRADAQQLKDGLQSGFHECWEKLAGFGTDDFDKPSILNLWNFRKKDEFIEKGIYFQQQVTKEDLEPPKPAKKGGAADTGMSPADRRWLQIEKSKKRDVEPYLDASELKEVMQGCTYPLHFIDFETTAVAIPFNKGRRPYEQTAFQFSHHTISQNGTIAHTSQWINAEVGNFPNFEFVRALKTALEKDNGSVFRYAAHENTILNAIYEQLQTSTEPDRETLGAWIKTITHSKSTSTEKWTGARDMFDMLDWVKKFYYSPRTNGSNSIKQVLPAILEDSAFLKEKYSQPMYGTDIKSLNFQAHRWITFDKNGKVISPYYTLPSIHEGIYNEQIDTLLLDEESGIFDGGAAMTAYARMQFTQMSEEERRRVQDALLRYCELDTLAMVMIWEAWQDWCN